MRAARRGYSGLAVVIAAAAALCGLRSLAGQEPGRSPLMSDEQNQILDRVRSYATSYVSQLPNFVCVERTARRLSVAKGKPYKTIDQMESRLSFVDGKESYEKRPLQTIGRNRPRERTLPRFELKGEFGSLMRGVLVLDHASFSWLGWDTAGDARVGVFAYRVARDQSTLVVTNGSEERAVVAYHGLVFAAPVTGAVMKITADAEEIPSRFAFSKAVSEVSYGSVEIAGKNYLLPVTSVYSGVYSGHTRRGLFRNESEFREYRKFGSEATIKYGDDR